MALLTAVTATHAIMQLDIVGLYIDAATPQIPVWSLPVALQRCVNEAEGVSGSSATAHLEAVALEVSAETLFKRAELMHLRVVARNIESETL